MAEEQKNNQGPAEIESLNDKVLDADEASLDELEEVSGGCGTFTCGTYSPSATDL
jgi:hypothetical protein